MLVEVSASRARPAEQSCLLVAPEDVPSTHARRRTIAIWHGDRGPLRLGCPVRTPAGQAREATNIAGTDTPPREPRSATPQNIPQPPHERPAPASADEPASRQARLEPIPPSPQVLPEQSVKAAPREPLQPRQTQISATPLEPRQTAAAKTQERAIRRLEPVPLPAPDPLPLPASPPRDVAKVRQPTVTRRDIVTAPAPEPIAQPPSRTMLATAESVSRIGKLMPRRRAQLVFGLRRR